MDTIQSPDSRKLVAWMVGPPSGPGRCANRTERRPLTHGRDWVEVNATARDLAPVCCWSRNAALNCLIAAGCLSGGWSRRNATVDDGFRDPQFWGRLRGENQRVQFEVGQGAKGAQATGVTAV
jgi:hypothetical protein